MSDPQMFIRVERGLDTATAAMFPAEVQRVPDNLTQTQLATILGNAGLTADEEAWSDALFQMLLHAHVTHIGDATGRGLFRRLQDLELEFVRSV
jgi:hypothetical protein